MTSKLCSQDCAITTKRPATSTLAGATSPKASRVEAAMSREDVCSAITSGAVRFLYF